MQLRPPNGSLRLAAFVVVAVAVLTMAPMVRAAAAADARARLAATTVDVPASIQPGQRVVGNLSLRVQEPGPGVVIKPMVTLASKKRAGSTFKVADRQLTPWDWPAQRQAGDVLSVAMVIDLPVDFAPGPAELLVRVGHDAGNGKWQYAALDDSAGKAAGEVLRVPVEIVEPSKDGAIGVDLPFVISRIDAPTIDGKVGESEWARASHVKSFIANAGATPPRAQTRVSVGYDDTALYVAFECEEPNMPKAARQVMKDRDADVWTNECVEVLLNPSGDRAGYIHLIVDILNQRYDALGTDPWGFNPPWKSATHAGERGWSAEMAMPFASLGVVRPVPGQMWRANLCRERQAEAELSAWRPAKGQFAAPGTFGTWVFGTLKDYLESLAKDLAEPADELPETLRPSAAQWREDLRAWRQEVARDPAGMDAAKFHKLSRDLDGLRARHEKLKLAAAREAGQRFAIARAAPYAAFSPSATPSAAPIPPIEVMLLQDEHVDLAFDITNLTEQPLVLRCTTRHGEADASDYARLGIPGLESQWQEVVAVAAGDGQLVYDAIVPVPAGTIHVPAGRTTQAWLSIHAPPGAKGDFAGRVVIQPVDQGGGEAMRIGLAAKVMPIKLTDDPPIHCFTWNFAANIEEQPQWWAAHLRDLVSHGVDVCMVSSLNHLPRVRASADGKIPAELDFAKIDRLLKATRGMFRLYWINLDIFEKAKLRDDLIGLEFGSPAYERGFKQWLRQVLEHLRSQGLRSDQFMINPYDESVDERCRLLAKWVKEVDPNVRIVIDSSTPDLDIAKQMDALTDVWVPHHRQFFPAEMKPFHDLITSKGKPRWAYFYSEGSNDKSQDPSRHYLSKFWWAFANNVTGMGYWAQQYYGDPWYRHDSKSAYDTALWYPIEGGVAPSRRWQAWRQGWQDYLLLSRARQALRDRKDADGLKMLDGKVADVVSFPSDPVRADAVRAWAKRVLSAGR